MKQSVFKGALKATILKGSKPSRYVMAAVLSDCEIKTPKELAELLVLSLAHCGYIITYHDELDQTADAA